MGPPLDNIDLRSGRSGHRSTRKIRICPLLLLPLLLLLPAVQANIPPRFILPHGESEIVLRLKEGPDNPVGSVIYTLRGEDPDGDQLIFAIRGQIANELLKIESTGRTEANVLLRKELDREIQNEYSVVLTLTDRRLGNGNFITQSMLILVEDINDNEPVFKPYQSTIVVRENSRPGVIATVEATDQDEGPFGQVLYSLDEPEGDEGIFSIKTKNEKGVLSVTRELDYEKKSLYQLRVLAMDRSNTGKVNTATAAILVKVEDMEDQPPVFISVPPVTRIPEDVPPQSPVLQVRAVDGDRGVNNRIAYSIVGGNQGMFTIDQQSGVVSTAKYLDRESRLISNGAMILQIEAREVSDTILGPPPSVLTEVTIILLDINDETPKFRSPSYVAEIQENAQVDIPLTFLDNAIPEVFDHDQGNNGTFHMFLEGDGGVFDVTPPQGINEASFLIRVRDPTKLDYEKIKVMNFTIIAKESVPDNPKYSTADVTVYIRDVNDNYPEFTQNPYQASIPENARAGTTVAWVQAVDPDSGDYGTAGVRYTTLRGSVADRLHLDPKTGVITVRTEDHMFDREQVALFYLTVEARDDRGRGNRNTVQLIIALDDVNDNAPQFLQSKYETRLKENSVLFDIPLIVEARDLDLNGTANHEIRYSIVEGNEDSNFTINSVTGEIRLSGPIDFERMPGFGNVREIELTVEARDLGTPSLSSRVPVIVYVEDVNDHQPEFDRYVYVEKIKEDAPGGAHITQVKAFDRDGSSPNNNVVYRIQDGALDKFVIDPDLGIISVSQGANLDPDRTDPKTNNYLLKVVALDGGIGTEQRKSECLVNITIIDVNNKDPYLLDPGVVRVDEDVYVGSELYRVLATDLDDQPILRYVIDEDASEARNEEGTIVKSSDYNITNLFEMNSISGLIRVMGRLDRERIETFRLVIQVEDIAAMNRIQTATGTLTVVVNDVNDNDPKFRRPFYRRSIPENSKNGSPVVNVVADDPDKNRTITYTLQGPSEVTELVYLDEDTGEIVVAQKIDREKFAWLNFTVIAMDSGVPMRSNFARIYIQVIDENDNNPQFITKVNSITVREDAPIGTELILIEATDSDFGDYGKITYLLDRRSSAGKFKIDPDSGALTVLETLNREEQSSYNLIIEAWDNYHFGYSSGESRNAFKQLSVQVVDVNDETPEFEPVTGCVTVTEFHKPREPIFVVRATDKDDPKTPNGRIIYTIEGGNTEGLFYISSSEYTSARVYATKSLQGYYGNYTLKIMAEDQGFPPNSAFMDLEICVTDFNDHPPRFVHPPQNYTVKVSENATLGSEVIQIKAIDDDIGPNAAVRYKIRQDPMGNFRAFSIDSLTGVITVAGKLDRERQKVYEIRVEAYDLGIPTPLSTDLDLTIYVRNVNDFKPQFLVDEFTLNFTEHRAPGEERFRIIDTVDLDELDEDDRKGSVTCYFIVGGNENGQFTIDPPKHELMIIKELDREVQDEYVLLIQVSEECLEVPPKVSFFDPNDDTLLRLRVYVNDINDNPPRFTTDVFTGGVTTEADFGTEVMRIKAVDEDAGPNADLNYYMFGNVQQTLSEGLENIRRSPFIVEQKSGIVKLNFDPQKSMKGYFDFEVVVNDTDGQMDRSRVFIYLLREDQRVKFVFRQHPAEIRENIEPFRNILGEATGAIVNVDEYKIHENLDGSVDKTKTDVYLHFVSKEDSSIMEVHEVLRVVDVNIEILDPLFKEYNVLDTQAAEPFGASQDNRGLLILWLIGVIVFLTIMLILVISICLSLRTKYTRQLKAATATAFGSNESSINRVGQVPNTNIHSVEGSNPIWMQSYTTDWYKDSDSMRYIHPSDGPDSLDENAIVSESTATSSQTPPSQRGLPSYSSEDRFQNNFNRMNPSIRSTSNILVNTNQLNAQNDLNQTFRHNLIQHLDKFNNPLIAKKLETTEL